MSAPTTDAIEAAAIPAEAKEIAREAVRKLLAGVGTRATAHDYQVMLTALSAAAPIIAAQALRDAADEWFGGPRKWLRERADQLEGKDS